MDNKILEEIRSCIDCKNCMDVCQTFIESQDDFKSPNGRLKIAEKVFQNEEILDDELIGIYTCTLCSACGVVCSQNINIADIIHALKIKLVDNDKGPLSNHNKIIQGIIENDNSVGGKPEERLSWLPEKYRKSEIFEKNTSETLLFLGCMSSYRVQESASAPYKILKKANYDFKILKNEPCCGEYVYSAGKLDIAKKIFRENIELFNKLGVKKIIVTCGGCLYAFDTVYRKYFKDFNIEVKHIVDVVYELEKEGKINLKPLNQTIAYHDPCRLGRKYENGPLFSEPRELLKKSGLKIEEITEIRENHPCCGAGSGIRGVDSNLCIKIGKTLLGKIESNRLVSSCPLCIFNFRYVNYKSQMDKDSKYITDYILESMMKQ